MLAPVMVAKWNYYGYWLPNTYFVKSNAGLVNLHYGIDYLWNAWSRYDSVMMVLAIALGWRLVRPRRTALKEVGLLLVIVAAWLLYVAARAGDNMVGGRVLVPILPLVYVAMVWLLRDVPLKLAAVGTAVLCATLIHGYTTDERVRNRAERWRRSAVLRRDVGTYLHDHFPPDTLVAVSPGGMIPFYSGLPTIDMLGLNDVHIARHGERDRALRYAHQAGDGSYVLSRRPDVIIFGNGKSPRPSNLLGEREIWRSREFRRRYRPVEWPGVGHAYIQKQ